MFGCIHYISGYVHYFCVLFCFNNDRYKPNTWCLRFGIGTITHKPKQTFCILWSCIVFFTYSSVAMSSTVVIWTRWGRKVHEEENTCWDCSGVTSDNRLNMYSIFCPRHQKYTRSAVEQRNTRDRVCHGRANQIMVCQATMCLLNHERLPMSQFL